MTAFQLSDDLAQQINDASTRAGETPDAFLRQAVLSRLDDMEDAAIITARHHATEPTISLHQLKANLGLDN